MTGENARTRHLVIAACPIAVLAATSACIDVDPNWTFGGGGQGGGTPTYASVIAADGPIAWYRLDEADGAAISDQMGRYPAVLSPGDGSVEWAVGGAIAGDNDGAIRLTDGASITLTVPPHVDDLSFEGQSPYSVEAWVVAKAGTASVLSSSTFIGDAGQQTSIYEGFEYVEHERRDGTTSNTETWTLDTPAEGFHHVVATYDGEAIRVYLDGLPATSTGAASSLALPLSSLPFTIAESDTFGDTTFDELAIYDYVLSVDRIGAHFRCGSSGDCAPSP